MCVIAFNEQYFSGFAVTCVGSFIFYGVQIGLFTTLKPILTDRNSVLGIWASNSTLVLPVLLHTIAGLVSYPFQTIRCRMMLSSGSGNRQYQSAVECGMKIIRYEGFLALMNGAFTKVIFNCTASIVTSFLIFGLKTAAAKNQ